MNDVLVQNVSTVHHRQVIMKYNVGFGLYIVLT
jgi:hypothetical protein